ncbi:hypothetical protein MTO96_047914 [Rhipicephalus appendiculatus]
MLISPAHRPHFGGARSQRVRQLGVSRLWAHARRKASEPRNVLFQLLVACSRAGSGTGSDYKICRSAGEVCSAAAPPRCLAEEHGAAATRRLVRGFIDGGSVC